MLEQRNTTDFDKMQMQYSNQIKERIMTDETINIGEIETFFSENKRILRFIHLVKTDSLAQTTEYIYPSSTTKEHLNEQPIIPYSIQIEGKSTKWDIKIALDRETLFSKTPNNVFIISIIFFVTYWILYGLWNVMNAYRMGRLNLVWVVLFFTLNIFAYLIYKSVGNFQIRRVNLLH